MKNHKGNLIDDRLLNVILKLGKMVVYLLRDSPIVALDNCNGLQVAQILFAHQKNPQKFVQTHSDTIHTHN